MADVQLNERAIEELLTDPAGPVGQLLQELAEKMTAIARREAPVRKSRMTKNTSGWPPGYTKSRTRVHSVRVGKAGSLYAGTDAPANPGIFLEYPASQMPRRYPFLTTALDALEGDLP